MTLAPRKGDRLTLIPQSRSTVQFADFERRQKIELASFMLPVRRVTFRNPTSGGQS